MNLGNKLLPIRQLLRKDIKAAEQNLSFNFPPSYRAFLKLHNGWRGFNAGDICVLGVSGPGYTEAAKELKRYLTMISKAYRREGPRHVDELQEQEKTDPNIIYLPGHPVVALNFNGEFWVFDRNRSAKDGEYEIAQVSRGEDVEMRYCSFLHFVDNTIQRLEHRLDDLGGDSEAITASVASGTSIRPLSTSRPTQQRRRTLAKGETKTATSKKVRRKSDKVRASKSKAKKNTMSASPQKPKPRGSS